MDGRERLIKIMNSQGLNAKQLSLELEVSAGTISNIMSGRNKPSLELLQNIATHFPFLASDWLFMGEGNMYKTGYEQVNHPTSNPDLFSQIEEERTIVAVQPSTAIHQQSIVNSQSPIVDIPSSSRAIQKIVIFYSDGTFEER